MREVSGEVQSLQKYKETQNHEMVVAAAGQNLRKEEIKNSLMEGRAGLGRQCGLMARECTHFFPEKKRAKSMKNVMSSLAL